MKSHFCRHQLLLGNKLRLIVRHFTQSFGSIPVPDHWPLTALNGPSIPSSPIVPDPFHCWFRTSAWLEWPIHKRRALFRPSFPNAMLHITRRKLLCSDLQSKMEISCQKGWACNSGLSWNFGFSRDSEIKWIAGFFFFF